MKKNPGVDWTIVNKDLLTRETVEVYNLYLSQQLREHYFNEENCVVLVLECINKQHAEELLKTLPLVEKDLIRFEIMELHPYNGYERILQHSQPYETAKI